MKKRSTKTPFIIYPDLEPLHEKISTCHNNPKKSSTSKINEHRPSRCSLFTQCLFDATKNNIDCYRHKDCMKMFCKYLKQHATKVIKYEKTEMIPITNEKNIYIVGKKKYDIFKARFSIDDDNKNYHNVKDHFHYAGKYRGAAHDICNLRHKTPK